MLMATGAKSLDLASQVDHFKDLCVVWEKYDRQLSALNVVHTRKYAYIYC
jgi:hypothetical protein